MTPADPVIELEGVSRTIRGTRVLQPFDWVVSRGSLTGLVGRSGAGKTTTLRIVLGFIRSDTGTVRVLGCSTRRIWSLRGRVGAALDRPALENRLTVEQNLRLHALRYRARAASAATILERLELTALRHRRAGRLSQGERQRLGLALALSLEPEVLVLDEPLAHLDPASATRVLEVLQGEVRERGATVLLSSHHLSQVESVADHLALLHRGRLLLDGPLSDLLGERRTVLCLRASPAERAHDVLEGHPIVERLEANEAADGFRVHLREDRPAELNASLHQAGCSVSLLAPEVPTLQDLFRDTTQAADREEADG